MTIHYSALEEALKNRDESTNMTEKTLRDEFAMAVASACFTEVMNKYTWGQWDSIYSEVATMSYGIADAMLEARKSSKGNKPHEVKPKYIIPYCDDPARGY